jgi:hypothetical protein
MRPPRRTGFFCSLWLAASLQAQSSLPPQTWRTGEAPAELHDPIAQGDLIVVSLQAALLRELTDALRQGGPVFALQSCHIDVAGAAARIARQPGVRAGRTSDRLRNTANVPPAWAASLGTSHSATTARDVDGFAVDLGDTVGLLRPIVQRPMCRACHGPPDRIDPAVRAALQARYPKDRAIGFRDGEIRGWFWVEISKQRR